MSVSRHEKLCHTSSIFNFHHSQTFSLPINKLQLKYPTYNDTFYFEADRIRSEYQGNSWMSTMDNFPIFHFSSENIHLKYSTSKWSHMKTTWSDPMPPLIFRLPTMAYTYYVLLCFTEWMSENSNRTTQLTKFCEFC